MSRGLRRAIDGAVVHDSLSEALHGWPVDDQHGLQRRGAAGDGPCRRAAGAGVGGLVEGLLPFENGAAFAQGRVQPFARAASSAGPWRFPMRGGTGLMGEAGPEAIMPLAARADGKLGVRAEGGGGPSPW